MFTTLRALPLGSICAVAYFLFRDGGRSGAAAVPFRLGCLAALAVGIVALFELGCLVRRRLGARRDAALGFAVLVLVPAAFGGWAALAGTLGGGYAVLVAAGGLGLAGAGLLLRRSRPGVFECASVVWSVACALSLAAVHYALGTLAAVRPGTAGLHLALFGGTWGATVLLALLPAATAVARPRRVRSAALGGAALVLGTVLGELDRRLLVGLYPPAHLWLAIAALGCWSFGAAGALELVPRVTARAWRRLAVGAGALLVLAALSLLATARPDIAARSAICRSTIGAAFVDLLAPPDDPFERAWSARIEYPQYLDRALDGRRPNVLLVTVDALRADAVDALPNLARFAAQSLDFESAYAGGARTAIGISTLLIGRYSANIEWDLWVYKKGRITKRSTLTAQQRAELGRGTVHTTIPRFTAHRTLAERFRDRGYSTFAVAFAGRNQFFERGVGFDDGFETFVDLTAKNWRAPTSAQHLATALDTLGAQQAPWFGWLHFYDPHEAHEDRARYDELCLGFDRAFGELIGYLERRRLLDATVVAVTADHGEAFGEHGHARHGSSLYDEGIHVPVLLRLPAVPPREIAAPVSTVDVAATLAAAVGADTAELDGVNLLAYAERTPAELVDRPVFAELHRYSSYKGRRTMDMRAVRVGPLKVIVDRKHKTIELFDLERDPGELTDLAGEHPEVRASLVALLKTLTEDEQRRGTLP